MLAVKVGVVAFALLLPLFGAWLASSLAAYANGPRWVLLPAALLGFPLLPLAWEGLASLRRARTAKRFLTFGDRLWLRTLALNVLFVAGLLWAKPEAGVRALQARGDWFLDGATSPTAARGRALLHGVANAFDWVYRLGRSDAHAEVREDDGTGKPPVGKDDTTPPPMPRGEEKKVEPLPTAPEPEPPPAPPPPPELTAEHAWPRPAELHPAIVAMTAADEISIQAVAAYVVAHEPSRLGQLKALHDWAADRVVYDIAALTGPRPPQTAEVVFRTRKAVCAGYADLLVAFGKAANLPIRYVIGDARGQAGEVDGAGHAWNVATIDGGSYLLDATWDAGYREGDRFVKSYSTEYLFTPPTTFGIDHFPEKPADQLLSPPQSRGDFMRTPQLRPGFFARGLTLAEPTRSQVTTLGGLDVQVTQSGVPSRQYMLATFEPKGGGASTDCAVHDEQDTLRIRCDFPARGEYRVLLFASPRRYGTYDFVGELLAQDAR